MPILLALLCRRHRSTGDSISAQCLGNETRRFHFLDECAKRFGGFEAAGLRCAHGLPDHHEAFVEQPEPAGFPRIGFELLLDAGCNFEILFEERLYDGGRRRRTNDLRGFQCSAEK